MFYRFIWEMRLYMELGVQVTGLIMLVSYGLVLSQVSTLMLLLIL